MRNIGDQAFIIRRALSQDAEGIHHAHMKSIQEVCSKDHSPEEIKAWGHRPYIEEQRKNAIAHDGVWVVDDQGSIEGFGHIMFSEKNGIKIGYVKGLYLTPKVLGNHLGRSIVELMMAEATKREVDEVILEATLTAHDFYKKMGFEDSGPMISVEISGQEIRCYPMKKILK